MEEERYSKGIIRRAVRAVVRFGKWLEDKTIATSGVNEEVIASYVDELRLEDPAASPRNHKRNRAALRLLLAELRERGAAAPPSVPTRIEVDTWLGAFDDHLREVAGCAVRSRA